MKYIYALIACFSITLSTVAYGAVAHHYSRACRARGGLPILMHLFIDTGHQFVASGTPRLICVFFKNRQSAAVAADTLSSKWPSLAATAYRNAPTIPIPSEVFRKDIYYCQYLGGTIAIGNMGIGAYAQNSNSNYYSLCMFSDGSAIDTWTLFYQRLGIPRATDLTDKFKSPVLPIPPTQLWWHELHTAPTT